MSVLEFSVSIFFISTSICMIAKFISDSLYTYLDRKNRMDIEEYRRKKDIDLYYENELIKIKSKSIKK